MKLSELKFDMQTLFIIFTNFSVILSVLFLGTEFRSVILLYWLESGVIGIFNVIKMLLGQGRGTAGIFEKIFMVPFFIVHYGMFMFVHLIFLVFLLGLKDLVSLQNILLMGGILLSFIISHGIDLVTNYLSNNAYKTANPDELMFKPYGRIIIMHITILFGAFLYFSTGKNIAFIIILIVLKTGADIIMHLREQKHTTLMSVVGITK